MDSVGITRLDVRALVGALASERSAVIPVAELYRWYQEQMDDQERIPVSQKAFGQALDRCGQRSMVRRINGQPVRCRVLHKRYLPPEEEDYQPRPA